MKDMLEKIKSIEKSYNELGVTLSDPEVIQDYNKFKQLSKKENQWKKLSNSIINGRTQSKG